MPSCFSFRSVLASCFLVLLGFGVSGCGSSDGNPDPDAGDDVTIDGTADGVTDDVIGDDTDAEEDSGAIGCLSTFGCSAEFPGSLCLDGACVPCETSDECHADAFYGDESSCVGGACAPCDAGEFECVCDPNDICDFGLRCADDGFCEECPEGELGCPCPADEVCDGELVCLEGVCAEFVCVAGTIGCPCDGGECEAGSVCDDDSQCYECQADRVDCPCDDDNACSNDLVCDGDDETCRDALGCDETVCEAFQLCAETDGEDASCLAECETGYIWNGATCDALLTCDTTGDAGIGADCAADNRECVSDANEFGAACGGCLTGFIDRSGDCEAVLTCDDLADVCGRQNRDCAAGDDATDASCGDCLPLYEEIGGSCFLGDLNCDVDDEFSILDDCVAQNRVCDNPDDAVATCGDCVDGFSLTPEGTCETEAFCVDLNCDALFRTCSGDPFASCGGCEPGLSPSDPEDPNSTCRTQLTCDDLTCEEGEFCVESSTGGDAACVAGACGEGEAFNESTGACVTCEIECSVDDEGSTGRLWNFTREGSDDCICETLPGYFADTSRALLPQPCDADGDGWIRESAQVFLNSGDAAVRANARCDVLTVDGFALENEWGQQLELSLCGLDIFEAAEAPELCDFETTIELFESDLTDSDDTISDEPIRFPTYSNGVEGRALLASEVNPLTKACVTPSADYNANDVADIEEAQGMAAPEGVAFSADQFVWNQLSFFVELHEVELVEGADGLTTLLIRERSRCDTAAFPLTYPDDSEYWRECTRDRRAGFDAEADPQVGYDFARYACDAATGACGFDPPVVGDDAAGLPERGVCTVDLASDATWRGFQHHSQFQCVQAVNTPSEVWEVDRDTFTTALSGDLGSDGFNLCAPSGSADSGDAQPSTPLFACTPAAPSDGQVGFRSVRFAGSGDASYEYVAGCIDEFEEWAPDLCPGWVDGPFNPVTGDADESGFGALSCGCGENYGGATCERGCANPRTSSDFSSSDRAGAWLCGDLVLSTMSVIDPTYGVGHGATVDGDEWIVRGNLAGNPRSAEPNCIGDCGTGWELR